MIGHPLVPLAGLVCSFLVLYWPVLGDLVRDWRDDANFSHGFLVLPIAAWFVWQRRGALAAQPAVPRWSGLPILLIGLAMLGVGVLGAELFVSRVSMLVVLSGIVVFTLGWSHLRVLALPIAFLLLMIPLPAIVFNQVAFPLQLVASSFGETVLRAWDIPVLREGNVIRLAGMDLEVAEACSGIRSLISLIFLSTVYACLVHPSPAFRAALILSTLPVAIVANGLRVAGTGIAAHHWGPVAAEGFFHDFGGWLVFGVALVALVTIQQVLARLVIGPRSTTSGGSPGAITPWWPARGRVLAIVVLFVFAASGLADAARHESLPARMSFEQFPSQLEEWRGTPLPAFDARTLAVLGADEYVNRAYGRTSTEWASLYIGFYGSQRQGDTMHSPLNCLPGAGWIPVKRSRLRVGVLSNGMPRPIDVNRFVIEKGLDRQLVLYWYQSRDRVVASEYWGKVYTVLDAVRLNRTDGALVRVVVPFDGAHASAENAAEHSAVDFVKAMFPELNRFLPA